MSPTPARTSAHAIVAAARALLEEEGLDAVSMTAVAARVGVRPPSLYKHVRDRAELVTAVVAAAAGDLGTELASATRDAPADPAARLRIAAVAYRRFARANPRATALLFADLGPDLAIPQAELARAAGPILELAEALVGAANALPAARTLTAFVHGFTTMESAGAFRLGGDVDEAFAFGIDAMVRGLQAAAGASPPVTAPT